MRLKEIEIRKNQLFDNKLRTKYIIHDTINTVIKENVYFFYHLLARQHIELF